MSENKMRSIFLQTCAVEFVVYSEMNWNKIYRNELFYCKIWDESGESWSALGLSPTKHWQRPKIDISSGFFNIKKQQQWTCHFLWVFYSFFMTDLVKTEGRCRVVDLWGSEFYNLKLTYTTHTLHDIHLSSPWVKASTLNSASSKCFEIFKS